MRTGLELGIEAELLPGLRLLASYTYSDFKFARFRTESGEDHDGRCLPGLPENLFYGELSYEASGFFASWDVLYVGERFANNANSVAAEAYTLSNVRLGYRGRRGSWALTPYVAFNNIFDQEYSDNLRVNAGNPATPLTNRYYEPAADFNVSGGLSVRYDFGDPGRGS